MKRRMLSLLVGSTLAVVMGSAAAQDSSGALAKAAKPVEKPSITAEQRSMLNEKLRLINQLVQQAGADRVGPNVSAEQQRWLLESLYQMPLSQIRAMKPAGSVEGVAREMSKAKAVTPKLEQPALGGLASELVYIPVTPCRLIDTRNVGGPIVGSRSFDLDANGSTYGGSASCNVVTNSGIGTSGNGAAVAINVAIVSPTAAPGFIGARPVGATNTTALVNWYQAGAAVQASNAGVVSYDQQGAVTDEIEFFGSPTQIIVDLFGVFAAPTATALDCTAVFVENTTIAANATFDISIPACPAGYTMTGAGCRTPGFQQADWAINGLYKSSAINPIDAYCSGRNITAGTITVQGTAQCCRLPGR